MMKLKLAILGSHKGIHKIGVFYVSLRCFPTHLYSKLDYIYPLMLKPSMKCQFLDRALERLVIEVNDVLEGPIDIKGVKLSFKFAGFIGDKSLTTSVFLEKKRVLLKKKKKKKKKTCLKKNTVEKKNKGQYVFFFSKPPVFKVNIHNLSQFGNHTVTLVQNKNNNEEYL